MPKDKSLSHSRVIKAINEEFLEKGYEAASLRSIAIRADMSVAGLYRHYSDKESMFEEFIKPLMEQIDDWMNAHKKSQYRLMESGVTDSKKLMESTLVGLISDILYPNKEIFKILVSGAKGTKYENYVHEFVHRQQVEMKKALMKMQEYGFKVRIPEDDELHIIMSAYVTAEFEPIIHDYGEEKMRLCLDTINQFFMQGWMSMMGL